MKLIEFFAQSYYCIAVMIASTIAALVVSIRYYGRHVTLRILTYYIAFSLLEDASGIYQALNPDSHSAGMTMIIILNAFVLFEYIVVHLFILHYIASPKRRRIIRINLFVFPAVLIFLLIDTYPESLHKTYFLMDCVFMVLPCLLYFYELFHNVNLQPLKSQPAFWIVTAFLFHDACSIPYMLTLEYLGQYQQAAASVVYILYGILFLFIIKANLCPLETRDLFIQPPNSKSL